MTFAATPLPAQTDADSTLTKRAAAFQQSHPDARLRIHNGRVEVRQRATRTGVKWGAITGGVGGALFGGFLGYLIEALCESECSGDISHGALIGGVLGGVAGTAAGGVTGGIIGAGAPKWVSIDARHVRPAPSHAIGSASLLPAFARPGSGGGGGAGARFAYSFETRHLALGPELGVYSLGSNTRSRAAVCAPDLPVTCTDTIPSHETVTHGGFNARLGTGVDRRVEPYLTAGSGFYVWTRDHSLGSLELIGYSVGAGVQLRNANGKRAVVAETRWQDNLSRSGNPDGKYGFYTFAIGGSLAW